MKSFSFLYGFGKTPLNHLNLCYLHLNYKGPFVFCHGFVRAANLEFSKVKPSYDEVSKRLLVKVPKSYILDNVVETEKTKVEDVKGNIFSDYPTQTIIDEINAHKKQLEEEKISNGFLEEADKRAELLLISHYSSNGYDEVIIEFY